MRIDANRLWASLEEVNALGARPSGGVERLAWTSEEIAARGWLAERCHDAGLDVERDEAGNVWAFGGSRPAIVLGSHLDTVPDGGRFDGALGVVAALEVLRSARKRAPELAERMALVCFTDEEGVRFGVGMAGSRAVAGSLGEDELRAAHARDGPRLWDVLAEAGVDPERVLDAARRRSAIAGYLELHVEQGRRLERAGAPVGVVSAIVGLNGWRVEVFGEANHAGTTLPEDRRDALVPIAALALAAQRQMRERPGVVATVGDAAVEAGASNIVPGRAHCTLDVRGTDQAEIDAAGGEILDAARAAAHDNGCSLACEETKRLPPAAMAPSLIAALERCAADEGVEAPALASMAGHDGMSLAGAGTPCGMLFVRSRGGISHSPGEHSEREDCVVGASVLGRAALALAAEMT